ncbi:MAG TPA: FAD-dependent oxidoreductase [Ktedonobacteraceae bacterium]|jgi:monoamine oxidase
MKQPSTPARVDYAIVGGGVSGLYAGWRLLQDRQHSREEPETLALFEMSGRIGGRLLTWRPTEHLRAELGGMRLLASQQLVWALTEHLDLEKTGFAVSGPNLRLFLRGTSTTVARPERVRERYRLKDSEQMAPGDLIFTLIEQILADNQKVIREKIGKDRPQTRQDWDRVKNVLKYRDRINGQVREIDLRQVGFWNALSDALSSEAYEYLGDSLGYYSLIANWNAAEALQNIDLDRSAGTAYKTLKQGFAALTDTLGQRLMDAGGAIHLQHRLLRIDREEAGKPYLLTFEYPHGLVQVQATRILLALPAWALKQIQPTPTFNPQAPFLKPLLDTVVGMSAFKLFLFYRERWWERACIGITQGRSVCDLPLRQTYYFAPDQKTAREGLLMASYDDARMVDYWRGMQERKPLPVALPREIQTRTNASLSDDLAALKKHAVAVAMEMEEPFATALAADIQGRSEELKTVLKDDMDGLVAHLAALRAQAQETETMARHASARGIAMNFSGLPAGLLEEEANNPAPAAVGAGRQTAGAYSPTIGFAGRRGGAGLAGQHSEGGDRPPCLHLATAEMCQRAREQLALLHGIQESEIPDPVYAAYADWSMEPFGGGWHFWEPGVNVEDAMKKIKQPLFEQEIYIVGEAYSGVQGWVEGALTTTEKVLQEKLGLSHPRWLNQDYYLGW